MDEYEAKYIAMHTDDDSDIIYTDVGLEWIIIYVKTNSDAKP